MIEDRNVMPKNRSWKEPKTLCQVREGHNLVGSPCGTSRLEVTKWKRKSQIYEATMKAKNHVKSDKKSLQPGHCCFNPALDE
jgi:hypothetical protein